jgi:hypothetical protein
MRPDQLKHLFSVGTDTLLAGSDTAPAETHLKKTGTTLFSAGKLYKK